MVSKKWLSNYALLVDYYEKYGNINININAIIDGVSIGRWLSRRRNEYSK